MATRTQGGMLLEAVIETLSFDDNPRRREVEKQRLERDFDEADGRLEKIVNDNHDRIKQSVHTFTKIDAQVTASIRRIRVLKENLRECKELLHCKRDNLRKLWVESLENKQILKLLDRIEEAKGVPEQFNRFIANKHYLHATELVVSKVAVLNGELSGVEALQDVRRELQEKEKAMSGILVDELHRHLYTKAALPKRKPGRSQSSVQAGKTNAPPAASAGQLLSHANVKKTQSRSASRALQMTAGAEQTPAAVAPIIENLEDEIVEDVMCRDPEENSSHFMAIIVESLTKLGTVPECITRIKERMHAEMRTIVEVLSEQVAASAEKRGESLYPQSSSASQSKLLLELLQLCFDKFRAIGQAHKALLCHLKRANQAYQSTVKLYPEAEVWSAIQYALQLLLTEYFDMQNARRGVKKTTTFNDHSDVSAYFDMSGSGRKGHRGVHTSPERRALFNFERSSVAMNVSTYMREKHQVDEAVPTLAMQHSHSIQAHLCKPQASNVTVVFNAIQSYIKEIEAAMNLKDGKRCSLYEFIEEFVRMHYVDDVQAQLSEKLDSATKGTESNKLVLDDIFLKKNGSARPLLQGALSIWECVKRLRLLMEQMPPYAMVFRRMTCSILSTYFEHCSTVYRRCVRFGDDSSEALLSAYWLRDSSITESFRSQPSWKQYLTGLLSTQKSADNTDGITSKFEEESRLMLDIASREDDGEGGAMPALSDACILGDREIDELKLLAGLQQSVLVAFLAAFLYPVSLAVLLVTLAAQVAAADIMQPGMGTSRSWSSSFTLKCGEMFGIRVHPATLRALVEHEGKIAGKRCQEWLAMRIRKDVIPVWSTSQDTTDGESEPRTINELLECFSDLAANIILLLHIELRLQCVHFLLPVARRTSYICEDERIEVEPAVLLFNRKLSSMEETLAAGLDVYKTKYMFDGLGHLMAILMRSATIFIQEINANGIKKLCRTIFSLQQNLTNLTMAREIDLDRSRQYFELLHLNGDELLKIIAEQGAVFSEAEYEYALRLMSRSHTHFNEKALALCLEKLKEILTEAC